MIEETARVVAVEEGAAWVETQRQGSCGHCAARGACGTSVLAQVVGRRTARIRALNPVGARPGEQVLIGIREGALLRGSFMLYGLPLLGLIGGGVLGDWVGRHLALGDSELLSLVLAAAGFGVGMALVRRFGRRIRSDARYQPVILKRIGTGSALINS